MSRAAASMNVPFRPDGCRSNAGQADRRQRETSGPPRRRACIDPIRTVPPCVSERRVCRAGAAPLHAAPLWLSQDRRASAQSGYISLLPSTESAKSRGAIFLREHQKLARECPAGWDPVPGPRAGRSAGGGQAAGRGLRLLTELAAQIGKIIRRIGGVLTNGAKDFRPRARAPVPPDDPAKSGVQGACVA